MHFLVIGLAIGLILAALPNKDNSLMPEDVKKVQWYKMQKRRRTRNIILNGLFFGSIIVGGLYWIGNT